MTKIDVVALVQKNTPMKVNDVAPSKMIINHWVAHCPNCDHFIGTGEGEAKHNYCHWCGQKLDWGVV